MDATADGDNTKCGAHKHRHAVNPSLEAPPRHPCRGGPAYCVPHTSNTDLAPNKPIHGALPPHPCGGRSIMVLPTLLDKSADGLREMWDIR